MSLASLVAQDKWQDFDQAWTELIASKGDLGDLDAALKLVAQKKRMPRCLPLLREHAKALLDAKRPREAAELLGKALSGGGAPAEIVDLLYQAVEQGWSGEPAYPIWVEISGFGPGASDPRRAWDAFERAQAFQPGRLLYHPAGWGAGEVLDVDLETRELGVRFESGRRDRFPLAGAVDIFESLPEEDLRAIRLRDPARLKKMLKDEPLAVLRAVVERHNGRASTAAIKNALMQVGVEGGSWAAWWRKARKAAETDPWLRLTGSAAKGEVQTLQQAVDPAQDARRRLAPLALGEALAWTRDLTLGGKLSDELRAVLSEQLLEKVEPGSSPQDQMLAAWMLVRELSGTTPEPLIEFVRASLQDAPADNTVERPPMWSIFEELPGAREQEQAVSLLQEVLEGDAWVEESMRNLHHAPSGMVRPLIEALHGAGRKDLLAEAYRDLLLRPLRAPDALIQLARYAESGRLGDELPPPEKRAESLLSLASYLHVQRKGDASLVRAYARLIELLTGGSDPLLERLLADAGHETLQGLRRVLQRGVDETVDNLVTDLAMHRQPEEDEAQASGFWQDDRIWTTRRGRARRLGELKLLVEVKIPQNEEALGRAAAMGDLSENFEWSSAIEEQRNLADRRKALENELGRCSLIENALLPEDLVAPGTWVRYRDLGDGEEHTIEILGPWDTDLGDNVVSYRAPLAWGLLGKRVGQKATVTLPSGEIQLEVLELGPVDLSAVDAEA